MNDSIETFWYIKDKQNEQPLLVSQNVNGVWSINLFIKKSDADTYTRKQGDLKVQQITKSEIKPFLEKTLHDFKLKCLFPNIIESIISMDANTAKFKLVK